MKEVSGGLWLAGLLALMFSTIGGILLIGAGTLVVVLKLINDNQKQAQVESWRKNYPSYKY